MNLNDKMSQMLSNILKDRIISVDYRGIEISVLENINSLISIEDNIKLILVCDYTVAIPSGKVNNLDVLTYLNKITRLTIFNHSRQSLLSLDNLKYVNNLTEFSLQGYIKQSIKLDCLLNYDIIKLDLDLNATPFIYKLISSMDRLKVLKINSLDLSLLNGNKNLVELGIKKTIMNYNILNCIYPLINNIYLNNVKKIDDFSFLSQLNYLKNISLRNTNISIFPNLHIHSLDRIELISNKKLNDISSILSIDSIKKIFISQCDSIPFQMLESCTEIKGLKQFYLFSLKTKAGEIIKTILRNKQIKVDANDFWD